LDCNKIDVKVAGFSQNTDSRRRSPQVARVDRHYIYALCFFKVTTSMRLVEAAVPAAILLLCASTAGAQTVPEPTPESATGQAADTPAAQAVPTSTASEPASGASEASPTPNAAPPVQFNVDTIEVAGVTILDDTEIERVVYPFTGPNRTSDDIEAARKALQDAYTARGYEAVVVEIPSQKKEFFDAGIIQIKVAEAPVGEVRVVGAKHHSAQIVRDQLASVEAGKPLNLKALQTDLAEANRVPDRTVMPSFKPGKEPGAIDVELKVKDSLPFHASLDVNNDNSPNTTKLRMAASARLTNMWGVGHTLSASYIMTPQAPKETSVVSLSYNAPLLGTPWSLVAFGYKSNSTIAALGGTQVLGDGYQVGLRAMYRLPNQKNYQALSFGVDFKDFKQNIFVANELASKAPIRYIPMTLGYTYSGAAENSETDLNITATFGLRVIKHLECLDANIAGCTAEDQFTLKDFNSRENFAHFGIDASYSHTLFDDVSAALRFAGQYADSHLVTNEQFGIGGSSTVRGYFQSEVVGDRGFAASSELVGPSLAQYLPSFVGDLRAFAFLDGGIVGVIDPLPEQDGSFRLASFGGGMKIKLFKHLKGDLTVGVPLISRPESRRGKPRVNFSVKGEF
jgi:hemolysin activation/secretion protein